MRTTEERESRVPLSISRREFFEVRGEATDEYRDGVVSYARLQPRAEVLPRGRFFRGRGITAPSTHEYSYEIVCILSCRIVSCLVNGKLVSAALLTLYFSRVNV